MNSSNAIRSAHPRSPDQLKLEAKMRTLRGLVLCVCAALSAAGASVSRAETSQDFDRLPFFAPSPWFQLPPWRQRDHAPPRKRKAVRSAQRPKFTQPRKRRQVALAVANRAARARNSSLASQKATPIAIIAPKKDQPGSPSITCEKAQAIVAEYGFKDIRTELCLGNYLNFNATRDGKPFWIQILAANGELARVRLLR